MFWCVASRMKKKTKKNVVGRETGEMKQRIVVVPKSVVKINTFPKNFNRFCFHIIPFFVFVFDFCRDSFPSSSCWCCCCCRAPLHSSVWWVLCCRFYQLRIPICRIYLNAHYTMHCVYFFAFYFDTYTLPIHISLVLLFLPIILLLTFVFILL